MADIKDLTPEQLTIILRAYGIDPEDKEAVERFRREGPPEEKNEK